MKKMKFAAILVALLTGLVGCKGPNSRLAGEPEQQELQVDEPESEEVESEDSGLTEEDKRLKELDAAIERQKKLNEIAAREAELAKLREAERAKKQAEIEAKEAELERLKGTTVPASDPKPEADDEEAPTAEPTSDADEGEPMPEPEEATADKPLEDFPEPTQLSFEVWNEGDTLNDPAKRALYGTGPAPETCLILIQKIKGQPKVETMVLYGTPDYQGSRGGLFETSNGREDGWTKCGFPQEMVIERGGKKLNQTESGESVIVFTIEPYVPLIEDSVENTEDSLFFNVIMKGGEWAKIGERSGTVNRGKAKIVFTNRSDAHITGRVVTQETDEGKKSAIQLFLNN